MLSLNIKADLERSERAADRGQTLSKHYGTEYEDQTESKDHRTATTEAVRLHMLEHVRFGTLQDAVALGQLAHQHLPLSETESFHKMLQ